MCTTFINAARKAFKSGGVLFNEHGVDEGHTFIVGYSKRLFSIEDDNQVRECVITAIGSGMEYALGAVDALRGRVKDPKKIILKALEIVGRHDPKVGPPYYVETL